MTIIYNDMENTEKIKHESILAFLLESFQVVSHPTLSFLLYDGKCDILSHYECLWSMKRGKRYYIKNKHGLSMGRAKDGLYYMYMFVVTIPRIGIVLVLLDYDK